MKGKLSLGFDSQTATLSFAVATNLAMNTANSDIQSWSPIYLGTAKRYEGESMRYGTSRSAREWHSSAMSATGKGATPNPLVRLVRPLPGPLQVFRHGP